MAKKFFDDVINRYPSLKECESSMHEAFQTMADCFKAGNKLLVCGNGGSSSDSDHIVGELLKGFLSKRELTNEQVEAFKKHFPGEEAFFADNLQQGLPAISLTCNGSINTAVANDTNPEMIFAQQLFGLGKAGDVMLAISTSGNSRNVVHAAKVARALGVKTIGLTGKGGGALAELSDICIRVPADKVHLIQELHLPVYHGLCAALEAHFFEGAKGIDGTVQSTKSEKRSWPEKIELLVFDFDGVFTNNKVIVTQDGVESVLCDRSDSLRLPEVRERNIPMMVVSTEKNPVVEARAAKLKIPSEFGCQNKENFLESYCTERNISLQNVVFVGNDINDLGAMKKAGFAISPRDGRIEIRQQVDHVLNSNGGDGALREICELIIQKYN